MSEAPDRASFDGAGLQNERTSLAWVRTSLSLLGVGVLVAKQSGTLTVALGLMVVVAVVAGWVITETEVRHHARHQALQAGDPIVALHHVSAMAAVVTALAATSLVIVVT